MTNPSVGMEPAFMDFLGYFGVLGNFPEFQVLRTRKRCIFCPFTERGQREQK